MTEMLKFKSVYLKTLKEKDAKAGEDLTYTKMA